MSRWDALKPVNKQPKKQDPYGRKRSPTATLRPRPSQEGSIGRDSYIQLRERWEQKDEDRDKVALALATCVTISIGMLPVEQVVDETIDKVFLRWLETKLVPSDSVAQPQRSPSSLVANKLLESSPTVKVLLLLQSVLKDARYASAIMAPLVEDVAASGEEVLRVNPVRQRLFQNLQQCLFLPHDSQQDCACETLIVALEVAFQLDGTKRLGSTEPDVSVSILQPFVDQKLSCQICTKGSDRVLRLLHAVLRRHPESARALVLPLLEGPASKLLPTSSSDRPLQCRRCRFSGQSTSLLALLHESQTPYVAQKMLARCLVELINHLPLSTWFPVSRAQKVYRPSSTLSFPRRILSCLENALLVMQCRLDSTSDKTLVGLATFAQALLVKIPFEQVPSLMDPTFGLLSSMARHILENGPRDVRCGVANVYIELSGGRILPDGSTTTMNYSLRNWLEGDTGRIFFERLLIQISQSPSKEDVLMCKAFLRSHPYLVEPDDEFRAFMRSVHCLAANEQAGLGMELLGGFLRGRKEAVTGRRLDVPSIAGMLATRFSEGSASVSVKKAILSCYSCFLSTDWDCLGFESVLGHLHLVMGLCRHGGVELRCEGNKMIGEFCDVYFVPDVKDTSHEERQQVCTEICATLIGSVADENSRVRSMALLAIGNLAHALVKSSAVHTLDDDLLSQVVCCLDVSKNDTDEKVVTNAIRALGHVGAMVIGRGIMLANGLVEPTLAFLRSTMSYLTDKIQVMTVRGASGVNVVVGTWKQRQTAKKHAWGSCNTLACLFRAGIRDHNAVADEYKSSVKVLLDCIRLVDSIHDKVVLCASAALRAVGSREISQLLGRDPFLGKAVVSCSLFVFQSHQGKLLAEVRSCLCMLLDGLTVGDASVVLLSAEFSTSELLRLYDFMTENGCSAQSFSSFALAMNKPDTDVDPEVELRFSNRALAFDADESELAVEEL